MDPAYATLLVPVVGGAVTAMGLYVKEWHLARDKNAVRDRALADANAEVAFASEWWKASQLLGSDAPADCPQRMVVFLADAEARVAETQHLAAAQRNPVTFSRVLLLYPMHRRSARILKWLFFVALFFLVSTAAVLADDMSSHNSTDSAAVGGDVVLLIGIMVLVLVLRLAATTLEHDADTANVHSTPARTEAGTAAPAFPTLPSSAETIETDGQRPPVGVEQPISGGP